MKPSIDTCLSPELLKLYDLEGKIAVVVDILRATSCMVAGLGSGVKQIVPVTSPEACKPYVAQGFLSAGEHGGIKYPDFVMGNSPFEYMSAMAQGQSVVVSTTNGTKAIGLSKEGQASMILAAAFLNINTVANFLKKSTQDIVIVCAGWKGRFSMEDTLFAGALTAMLADSHTSTCDASLAAKWLYEQHQADLASALLSTAHAARLQGLGIEDDIAYCAQLNEFNVLPILQGEALVKHEG